MAVLVANNEFSKILWKCLDLMIERISNTEFTERRRQITWEGMVELVAQTEFNKMWKGLPP